MKLKRALNQLQILRAHSPHRYQLEFVKIAFAFHLCRLAAIQPASPLDLFLIHLLITVLVVLVYHPSAPVLAYIAVYGAGLSSLVCAISLGRWVRRTLAGVFVLGKL